MTPAFIPATVAFTRLRATVWLDPACRARSILNEREGGDAAFRTTSTIDDD